MRGGMIMFGEVIPILDVINANKKLKQKNDTQDFQIPESLSEIDIKYLDEDYKSTIDAKNRFEDKAKTILAALTIAITLILNLSKIIDTVLAKFEHPAVNILIFVLAILAIIYMLMAGIMSIQVLIKENIVYPIPLTDRTSQDKKSIYIKTQLNTNQNLIRNNIIYSSYCSIRNSVFCLVIIFVLAILPFQMSRNDAIVYENNDRYENISFGMDAINWLSENSQVDISWEKIIDKYDEESAENRNVNIYDKENKIIIVIEMKDDMYVIENIISNVKEVE